AGCPWGTAAQATLLGCSGSMARGDAGRDLGSILWEDGTQRAPAPPTRAILQETPVTGPALHPGWLPSRVCQRYRVKGQTSPESGFLAFFPPCRSWGRRPLVTYPDVIALSWCRDGVAAPNTY